MEALGAAGSIVGIVSFGLGLATALQTYIEAVAEAEDTLALVVAEVNATASSLKRLQDLIETDKTRSREQNRPATFNDAGIKEVNNLALQCEKVYRTIIILIEDASVSDDTKNSYAKGVDETKTSARAAGVSTTRARLDDFSVKITVIGRKLRWPWLEPRIRRCQEHLRWLKMSLMLSLQVFFIGASHVRHDGKVAEDEQMAIREAAENIQKRRAELVIQMSTTMPRVAIPMRQVERDRYVAESSSANSTTSTSSSDADSTAPSTRASTSAVLIFLRRLISWLRRRFRRRPSPLVKDRQSQKLHAYMIETIDGILQPPHRIPFGHQRLARELKGVLQGNDPWECYLSLNVEQRGAVDTLAMEAEAKKGVLLIALPTCADSDSDSDSDDENEEFVDNAGAGDKMLLFFYFPPPPRSLLAFPFLSRVRAASETAEPELPEDVKLKMEEKREMNAEMAKRAAERKAMERKAGEEKRAAEAEKRRVEEEERRAAETALRQAIAKKRAVEEAEAAKKAEEEARKKRAEVAALRKKQVAEMKAAIAEGSAAAKKPIEFKDAVGRKFSFAFEVCCTWEGMQDLINEAFLHVDVIGCHVQQGHYDLMDADGKIILPSLWDATIQPGMAISMHMWPMDKAPLPGSRPLNFPHMGVRHPRFPPPGTRPGIQPNRPGGQSFPPPSGHGGSARPVIVEDTGPKTKHGGGPSVLGWISGSKPKGSRKGNGKDAEDFEAGDANESRSELDKELGFDDFAAETQNVEADLDKILGAWTNAGDAGGSAKPKPATVTENP